MSKAIEVQVAAECQVDGTGLSRAAEMTLLQHRRAKCGMTIMITDDDEVRKLNRQYREIDAVTDVLSFPATSNPQLFAGDGDYLGDIVIAFPYAMEQARKSDINLQNALFMLVVHGTLHLLGYDHNTAVTRKNMWAAQTAALQALRIDPNLVTQYGGVVLE